MKGLTLKELKNQLKKESCYTAILTTARIRGVEKIKLVYEDQSDETKDIKVLENMKFLDVIHREHVNANGGQEDDPFNAFYSYYLTEEKKSSEQYRFTSCNVYVYTCNSIIILNVVCACIKSLTLLYDTRFDVNWWCF